MSEPVIYTIKVQVLDSKIATVASMFNEVIKYAEANGVDGRAITRIFSAFEGSPEALPNGAGLEGSEEPLPKNFNRNQE